MRTPLRHISLGVNKTLLFTIFSLLLFGFAMLYSASSPLGLEKFTDGSFYLKRQLFCFIFGMIGLIVAMQVPYRYWAQIHWPLFIFSGVLLALVWVPGLGSSAGGARRWISLGLNNTLRFQPVELAKFSLLIFLATSIYNKRGSMHHFGVGIVPHFLIPSALLVLVLIQPDFGSFMTMVFFIVAMIFIGGARFTHLLALFLSAIPFFYFMVFNVPYRRKRLLAFMDPWADARNSGFQIIQSQIAFHRGGFKGVGLGEGQQKLFFLPDIHTDFIFSVVGEELGFIGVAIVVLAFLMFTLVGLSIALKAYRKGAYFACYLAAAMTLFISVPAFTNMAVTLGLLPTKGLVLPFMSYGGSAFVMSLVGCGLLLQLSRGQYQENRY